MISAILALVLILVHPVQAQPLEVRATVPAGGGVVVEWSAVRGAYLACVIRVAQVRHRDQLLGCADPAAPTTWTQGTGSRDLSATVGPGDLLEVRVWSAEGELLARGRARVGVRLMLPSIAKPPAVGPGARGER